jgi:hypothetical protein
LTLAFAPLQPENTAGLGLAFHFVSAQEGIMRLELSDKEMRTLIQLLEERLRALRLEIIHTSTHAYKEDLKYNERVLQCLHDKLVTYDALDVA